MPNQQEQEILRQRLLKILHPLHTEWMTAAMFAGVAFLFPLQALPSLQHVKEIYGFMGVLIPFGLIYQTIVCWWVSKLRKTLLTATPAQAHRCRRNNVLFGIISFVVLPVCGFFLQNVLCVFGGLLIAVLLFLPLEKVNRLIKSIDWQNPLSVQQADLSKDIPVLSVGSEAHETAQKLNEQPVTQITPLFRAVMSNDISALQKLLPTNELNRSFVGTGNTPLHVAALNGYTDIVRLLLEQPGIDTTRTNNNGKTALDLAREKGFEEITQLLENRYHKVSFHT